MRKKRKKGTRKQREKYMKNMEKKRTRGSGKPKENEMDTITKYEW